MRRKLYLNFLNGVAFRSSMEGWSSSTVKVRLLQQSHMKPSPPPPPPGFFQRATNTTPSNGVFSISAIFSRKNFVLGSPHPNSMSFLVSDLGPARVMGLNRQIDQVRVG